MRIHLSVQKARALNIELKEAASYKKLIRPRETSWIKQQDSYNALKGHNTFSPTATPWANQNVTKYALKGHKTIAQWHHLRYINKKNNTFEKNSIFASDKKFY